MNNIRIVQTDNIVISILPHDCAFDDSRNTYIFGNNIYEYVTFTSISHTLTNNVEVKTNMYIYFNKFKPVIDIDEFFEVFNSIMSAAVFNGKRFTPEDDISILYCLHLKTRIYDGKQYIKNPAY